MFPFQCDVQLPSYSNLFLFLLIVNAATAEAYLISDLLHDEFLIELWLSDGGFIEASLDGVAVIHQIDIKLFPFFLVI